jgi:isopentenyl-diphosphate delta-isomerase
MDQERLTKNGMGSKNAAQRKVFQELGIKADQCEIEKIQYLTRILYSADSNGKWAENELDYILFLKSHLKHLDIDPNPEEVKNVMYLNKASLTSVVEFKGAELI